jgi:hypothetical protein
MRISTLLVMIILTSWSIAGMAHAEQANSCKQCSEQRKTCMSNYSGPTCQTEYDRCMKGCKKN